MNPLPNRYLAPVFAIVLAFFHLPAAHAGSSAADKIGVDRFGDEAIRKFAVQLNTTLDDHKVDLAIVARSGRPRSQLPQGIRYTHVAFIIFEPVRTADGSVIHTYTVYNLYQGAGGRDDRSVLKQDFTYDFVAGAAEPDIAVCVPTEALQKRLIETIRSPAYVSLHNEDYNLVANPFVDRFDNCVTHTLKVCVAAIYRTDDRSRVYGDIREYFKPTPIHLGPVQEVGTRFMSSVSREDEDRSGLQTATYDSLKNFLETNGLVKESFTLRMPTPRP